MTMACKRPNVTFYGGDMKTNHDSTGQNFLSFSEVGYGSSRNSTPGEFAYIWRSELSRIMVIKIERPQILL